MWELVKRKALFLIFKLYYKIIKLLFYYHSCCYASQSASLQFIAPYTGCAIAEYIVIKVNMLNYLWDLSKHAAAYRQLSLLLRRLLDVKLFLVMSFMLILDYLKELVNWMLILVGDLLRFTYCRNSSGDLSGYIPTNIFLLLMDKFYGEGPIL